MERTDDIQRERENGRRRTGQSISEEHWLAIIANDSAYDGIFYYAVRTTGIYCRPSCKSRPPKRDNAEVFASSADAAAAGYRACKRCKPAGVRLPDEDWAEQIASFMDRHYAEELDLATLGDLCHGSPYHLHRTFKKVKGVTPLVYLQQTRMQEARKLLAVTSMPISNVGDRVGMRNTPYFTTLFKKLTGYTPAQYRERHKRT
ncbi:bifunctional transcriptional activator/DNA repair enzyme AdaA [Paenibacillus soyae]|uniref:Bifunctional transcriptional activator/DNA repair enzyme AdaA n=1 Tax=Paenibacillus soyae TaxID=2969249 RepID=A0A9X2MWT5_9BACL|nr:bifunctional transcriptional activator/DNA repair enzyme AdaA [Paenibacillus soyae]MCR2807809.1 bifunctional transcriptional activator/DNA repair enzyme AdaA [Paenibacillus soyae]